MPANNPPIVTALVPSDKVGNLLACDDIARDHIEAGQRLLYPVNHLDLVYRVALRRANIIVRKPSVELLVHELLDGEAIGNGIHLKVSEGLRGIKEFFR